jgi:site-specific DNA-methyltransferase (adenine-specific)
MTGEAFDYRLGRWQDVLADVECDAAIFDAPYGERTHRGHDAGAKQRNQLLCSNAVDLGYDYLTPADVDGIVDHWSPRTRGWLCTLTSHDLVPHWEAALERAGRYWFAPLPVLEFYRPRLLGDGPGSRAVWLIVSRPRSREFLAHRWGSLPSDYRGPLPTDLLPTGHYERCDGDQRPRRMGGKCLGVMKAIVGDYTRPGDLVCDMFGGDATTGRAAIELGRRFVGCERDPEAWAAGLARLREPVALDLFAEPSAPKAEQVQLWE